MSAGTAKLIGQKEPVKDQEIPCSGPVTVGRDPTANSLPINHPSISRKHGRVFLEGTVWNVEDLGSSNGTFLNDVRIQKVRLKDGDTVRFGDVVFKFSMARPEPVAASSGSSSDGFEPTIMISPANRPKVDAAPPSDFEGTVFGGQAPVFFANQMQKDQPAATANAARASQASSAAPPPPVMVQPVSQTPNMFALKMKAILFVVVLFSAVAIGVFLLIRSTTKAREIRMAVRDLRTKVEDFVSSNENRVLQADVVVSTYKNELTLLNELLTEVNDKLQKFEDGDPEQVKQLKTQKERVEFLVFERKMTLAVNEGDREGTTRLLQELAVNGTENQKAVVPLTKELLRFQHFRKNFPLGPERSVKAPEPKEVDELTGAVPVLKTEYEKIGNNPLVFGTHYARMVKNSIDNDEYLVRLWKSFFVEYDAAMKAEGSAKKDQVEKLKKSYPNLEMVQKL